MYTIVNVDLAGFLGGELAGICQQSAQIWPNGPRQRMEQTTVRQKRKCGLFGTGQGGAGEAMEDSQKLRRRKLGSVNGGAGGKYIPRRESWMKPFWGGKHEMEIFWRGRDVRAVGCRVLAARPGLPVTRSGEKASCKIRPPAAVTISWACGFAGSWPAMYNDALNSHSSSRE